MMDFIATVYRLINFGIDNSKSDYCSQIAGTL